MAQHTFTTRNDMAHHVREHFALDGLTEEQVTSIVDRAWQTYGGQSLSDDDDAYAEMQDQIEAWVSEAGEEDDGVSYSIEIRQESGRVDSAPCSAHSSAAALSEARRVAAQHSEAQVFAAWSRAGDGQRGYLDNAGNHVVTGEPIEGDEPGTTTIRLDDSITSHDETITLPHSIVLHEDGRADAVHVERADVEYPSLAALCEAYGLDEDEVKAIGEPVREYVWTTDAATWGTEPITDGDHRRLCQLAEDYLTEHEGDALSISVRRTRSGEIAGTYEVRPNGNLQILGASIAVPEDVRDLTNRAWEHALKAASAPRRWVLHEDSGATETIEAATLAEAVEQLREWIAGGEYEITSTVWTDGWVHAEDDPDERESVTVAIDPDEPDCVDGHTHDWHEVSVHGHGGGVISTDECRHCLARRTTDTWAQHPSTGEQGLHAVSYEAGHMICCTGCGDEISHDEAHWHGGEHYCQGCEAAPRED